MQRKIVLVQRAIFLFLLLSSTAIAGANSSQKLKFSQQAWNSIESIYAQIVKHPFNQEMAKGTLSPQVFKYYMLQDGLYLKEYVRVLNVLAAKLAHSEDSLRINRMVIHTLQSELDTREKQNKKETTTALPATASYVNFLLATAGFATVEELTAAILPCFWIYLKLGFDLQKLSTAKNPYHDWIKTYTSKDYENDVQFMIALSDRLAEKASDTQRAKMLDAFITASRYEWYFWDAAYKQLEWQP